MEIARMVEIVDGILRGGDLCKGCTVTGRTLYGSCAKCREVAADEIIKILKGVHDRYEVPKGE